MKTYLKTALRGALALTALLVCATAVVNAAAPVSPVGTWDCLLNGAHGQKGLAFLTFTDNGSNRTFNGFQLLVSNPNASSSFDINARNDGTAQGRGLFTASTTSSSSSPAQILVGFGAVDGPWTYDSKGRVIGSF